MISSEGGTDAGLSIADCKVQKSQQQQQQGLELAA